MIATSPLARLAAAFGIEASYLDVWGERVEPSEETRKALAFNLLAGLNWYQGL